MNHKQRAERLALVRAEHVLIVGVDVAKNKHWASIMDSRSELPVSRPFAFENSRAGYDRLLTLIQQAQQKTGAISALVAMEPSGHYWKPLAAFLRATNIRVVTVNPFHVKKAKEFDDNSPTKTDQKDSWVIARRANDADFFDPYLPEGIYADLRSLLQARQQQKSRLNQVLNQFQSILDEYFPEFVLVFKDPLGRAARNVLQYCPFPEDINRLTTAQIIRILQDGGNVRVGTKRALRLQEAAVSSIGVKHGLAAARLRLTQYLTELEFTTSLLRETEAAMVKALEATGAAPFLLSIPGIGVVLAASILAETGDLGRYEDWRQLRKLAGLNLTENSSGQQKGKTRISKRGRPWLRCLLYQAALVLVTRNAEFRALFHFLRTREKNRLTGKQALVAVGCKLLRVIWALVNKQCCYDPSKVLGDWRERELGLVS